MMVSQNLLDVREIGALLTLSHISYEECYIPIVWGIEHKT